MMKHSSLITQCVFANSPTLFLSNQLLKPYTEANKEPHSEQNQEYYPKNREYASGQNKRCHPERNITQRRISFNPQSEIPPLKPSALSRQPSAILLHGYGGRKEDMLAIGLDLNREGINCVMPDLPGHGESKEVFCLANVSRLIREINQLSQVYDLLLVGHSIGALIACNTSASRIAALSPPGEGFFEGNNKELLKILRVRRVNEISPYHGLQELITGLSTCQAAANCSVLHAKNDLRSVRELVSELEKKLAYSTVRISDANHLDIVTSSQTIEYVKEYAKEHFFAKATK